MFKRFLLALGLLLAVTNAQAASSVTADYSVLYDLDSTNATYCRVTGQNGDPFGAPLRGLANITTSGSSATTAAVTASSAPFRDVSVGDLLFVTDNSGTTTMKLVIAKADSDTVTVHSAWDLSATGGYAFSWKKTTCGTAVTNGWINVANHDAYAITIGIAQVNVTGGIDIQVQCRNAGLGGTIVQVFPACTTGSCNTYQNYAGTAGVASATTVSLAQIPYQECRVGMKIGSADDGGDTGTDKEQINISLVKMLSSR